LKVETSTGALAATLTVSKDPVFVIKRL